MNQDSTPIFTALTEHAKSKPVSFHVPGHKYGKVFPKVGYSRFSSMLSLDATEISGLDDLHAPEGVIKEAEALTADWYGVKESYLLVGGSTSGNLAMILSVCEPGDIVFVQRNCHKSIIHGLELTGVTPIFLYPEIEKEGHLPVGVGLKTVQEAYEQYPMVKALILTYPNYYGMASLELNQLIHYSHQQGVPVLVDEAHGAHFSLGSPFPISAIDLGADIVVQSAHKTLPAMTMGSYLHYNSRFVNKELLEHYLQVVQSSSPSYPIMASLDLARYYIANLTKAEIQNIVADINTFTKRMDEIPQIKVLKGQHGDYERDPLKVIVQTNCHASGYELQSLFEQSGIYTELADPYHVLFVLPLYPLEKELKAINKLKEVLKEVPISSESITFTTYEKKNNISKLTFSYQKMKRYQKGVLPLSESEGYVSAINVTPYPPGIPFLMAGEQITVEHIKQLNHWNSQGTKFQSGANIWTEGIPIFKNGEK